jgi:prephenate dehydratase
LTTRIGYLGPRGTFTEEALLGAVDANAVELVALETVYEAVMAVESGSLAWALVPIENSIEGPVTVTLDTLATEVVSTAIVGELVLVVHQALIAPAGVGLEAITTVVSHPHALGQCSAFLRTELPDAAVAASTSTAEAVRTVATDRTPGWAAIGARVAAEIYGCTVVRERIEDHPDNETRFVWLGRRGAGLDALPLIEQPPADAPAKTSVVFWGQGAQRPGWLVGCLDEFARRDINLTKIESRPRRDRLGQYMFFADLEGGCHQAPVADGLAGLRTHCHELRVLGSYPAARPGVTATLPP